VQACIEVTSRTVNLAALTTKCIRDRRQVLSAAAEQVVAPSRDARTLAKEARSRRKETAGRGWFDLPATQITDEVRCC